MVRAASRTGPCPLIDCQSLHPVTAATAEFRRRIPFVDHDEFLPPVLEFVFQHSLEQTVTIVVRRFGKILEMGDLDHIQILDTNHIVLISQFV